MKSLVGKVLDFMNPVKDELDVRNITRLGGFKPVVRGALVGAALGGAQLALTDQLNLLDFEPSLFAEAYFVSKWTLTFAVIDYVQHVARAATHTYKLMKGKKSDNNYETLNP